MKIVFLGTGAPPIDLTRLRAAASEVLLIGDDAILFDCGRWVSLRLVESGIGSGTLNYLFLTHHHRDHTIDLPVILSEHRRRAPASPRLLHVYGPEGTEDLMAKIRDAFTMNLPIEKAWPEMETKDVDEGLVCEGESWKITAARVIHTSAAADRLRIFVPEPSLAYRIDSDEGSVVISGDVTALPRVERDKSYSSNIALKKLARGADVYIMDGDPVHTTPEELGKAAQEAGVRVAVMTHIHNPGFKVPRAFGKAVPEVVQLDNDDFKKRIGQFFDGEIMIANDLETLKI